VGVLADRSPETLVAILGALKAGAAYVPLNADHPPARRARQLADANASIVVTVAELAELVGDPDRAIVLDDPTVCGAADPSPFEPAMAVGPDDPVYVLFTSGSTGVPKGVVVTHANLLNYATTLAEQLAEAAGVERTAALRAGVVTSLSTDLANTCIFPALAAGWCVDFVAAEIAMDPFRYASHRR